MKKLLFILMSGVASSYALQLGFVTNTCVETCSWVKSGHDNIRSCKRIDPTDECPWVQEAHDNIQSCPHILPSACSTWEPSLSSWTLHSNGFTIDNLAGVKSGDVNKVDSNTYTGTTSEVDNTITLSTHLDGHSINNLTNCSIPLHYYSDAMYFYVDFAAGLPGYAHYDNSDEMDLDCGGNEYYQIKLDDESSAVAPGNIYLHVSSQINRSGCSGAEHVTTYNHTLVCDLDSRPTVLSGTWVNSCKYAAYDPDSGIISAFCDNGRDEVPTDITTLNINNCPSHSASNSDGNLVCN